MRGATHGYVSRVCDGGGGCEGNKGEVEKEEEIECAHLGSGMRGVERSDLFESVRESILQKRVT